MCALNASNDVDTIMGVIRHLLGVHIGSFLTPFFACGGEVDELAKTESRGGEKGEGGGGGGGGESVGGVVGCEEGGVERDGGGTNFVF